MGYHGLAVHRARAARPPIGVGRIDSVGDDYTSGDGARPGIIPCGMGRSGDGEFFLLKLEIIADMRPHSPCFGRRNFIVPFYCLHRSLAGGYIAGGRVSNLKGRLVS